MLSTIKDTPYIPTEFAHRVLHPIGAETLASSAERGFENTDALVLFNSLSPELLAAGKSARLPDSDVLHEITNLLSHYSSDQVDTLPGMAQTLETIRDANAAVEWDSVDINKQQTLLTARCDVTAANLGKIGNLIRDGNLRAKAAHRAFSTAVEAISLGKEPLNKGRSLMGSMEQSNALATDKTAISTSTSYADLWSRIAIAVGNINKDYVEFYADLMQKYTKMYETYNNIVQKAASEAVNSASDANNVSFDRNKMKDSYRSFKMEVSRIQLGKVKGWSGFDAEQRDKMKSSLKPAYQIDDAGNISFDVKQFDEIVKNDFTAKSGSDDVLITRYQAWLASFNAVGNAFQSNMQSFSQSYGQSNNTFANLNKVLSGVINALGDSAKDVFKSLS